MELRDYQVNQKSFLEEKIKVSDTLAIESPTGSGKTIVMLQFIKEWLQKPENSLTNVIISTGFNKLVYLLEERAKQFGLNPVVLVGTKACNCPIKMIEYGLEPKVFTEQDYTCGEEHKHLDISTDVWKEKCCPHTRDLYNEHFQKITNNVGQLILTNHSSLLVHQKSLANTSLLIVDEAHTFSVFYDSYLKLELDKSDLFDLDKAINTIREPMRSIIKMNLQRGVELPRIQIDTICEKIESAIVRNKVREFFETKASNAVFIEKTPYSYSINKFYRSFDLDLKVKKILFSATLDDFTLDMFNVKEISLYKEYKTFCDYSKSEFIAIPNEDFKTSLLKFIEYVDQHDLKSGLILSTTITDMNIAYNQDGYCGFKMFKDKIEFENYKGKKILVGSRGLFQGIDIQGIEFVGLNKIPFPNWDDKAKAQQNYLTNGGKNGFDVWNKFTIPKTENDIIQATGRLWRSIDSKGIVSIFDDRIEKFKYIVKHTMDRYRHGITINIMNKDGTVQPFKVK